MGTPPYNPYPDQPILFSDLRYHGMPVKPKWELYSDSEILASTGNPRSNVCAISRPWDGATGPYAPILPPLVMFADDEEEYDEE